jgi:hypothetical protein
MIPCCRGFWAIPAKTGNLKNPLREEIYTINSHTYMLLTIRVPIRNAFGIWYNSIRVLEFKKKPLDC